MPTATDNRPPDTDLPIDSSGSHDAVRGGLRPDELADIANLEKQFGPTPTNPSGEPSEDDFAKWDEELSDSPGKNPELDDDYNDGTLANKQTGAKTGIPDEPNGDSSSSESGQTGKGLKSDKFVTNVKGKLGSAQESAKNLAKKKLLIRSSAGIVLLVIVGVGIFLLLLNLFKVPNYASNIALYRLTRTISQYSKTSSAIDAQKIAVDSMDDTAYKNTIVDKYLKKPTETMSKFTDKYVPGKAYKSLTNKGTIDYVTESKPRKFWWGERTKVKYIVVGDNYIATPEQKFGRVWSNYKERARFAGELKANLDHIIDYRGGWLVKGRVSREILSKAGFQFKFWDNKGKTFRGTKDAVAKQLALEQSYKNEHRTPAGKAASTDIAAAVDAGETEIQKCIAQTSCANKILETGKLPAQAEEAMTKEVAGSAGKSALGWFNTIYAIGVPVCLVFEGSTVNSKDPIDAQMNSTIAAYAGLNSATDQAKAGDTTMEAYGTLNDRLGDGDSVPDQIGRGLKPDTSVEVSPQANGVGEYTVFNAVLPKSVADVMNAPLQKACPVITDVKVMAAGAVVVTAIKLFVGISTFGTGTVATQGGEEAVKLGLKKSMENVIENITTKTTLKAMTKAGTDEARNKLTKDSISGYAKKFARFYVGTEAATLLAKMLVVWRMGAVNDASLSTGSAYKNYLDMGGVAYAAELDRTMLAGRPLTNAEVAIADAKTDKLLKERDGKTPLYEKYFATQNPRSLFSRFGYQARGFAYTNKPILSKYLAALNPTNIITSLGLGSKKASAEDVTRNSHYGIIQWGWTDEEEALKETESYTIPENAKILDESGKKTDIESKYGICYTETMGYLIANGLVVRGENGDVIENEGLCSPNNLGPSNRDYGDLVFRWRVDKIYNNVLDQNIAMQDPIDDSKSSDAPTDSSPLPANATANEVFDYCKKSDPVGKVKIVCETMDGMNGLPYASFWINKSNYDKKPPALGCNSYANMAIARATKGKFITNYCSGSYLREGVKAEKFKKIAKDKVEPGDLVIRDRMDSACGLSGAGHVEIVVSYDKDKDKLVTTGAHSSSTPSGVSDPISLKNSDEWDYGMVYTGGDL